MLKERIIEIILRDLYDDDEDYRTDATDCADDGDSILIKTAH